MKRSNYSTITTTLSLLITCLLVAGLPASAEVRLPHILSSNMVLQRDVPIPVWGWADPGEQITVKLDQHTACTKADAQGKWMVKLPEMKAGGPYEMTVSGKNTIKLTDILIGEVWICSGQSNMEVGIGFAQNAQQEIAAASWPQIRLFHLPLVTSGQPVSDVNAAWFPCSPQTVSRYKPFQKEKSLGDWGGFSAVGYYFGRELHKQLGIPVGMIDTSWGGTRIETWTPEFAFEQVPSLSGIAGKIKDLSMNYNTAVKKAVNDYECWLPLAQKALQDSKTAPAPPAWPANPLDSQFQPTGVYNAMVNPLVPFAIRGVIWYQGESNLGDGMTYFEMMKAMIGGWRQAWAEGDFPFYFAQLAPYGYTKAWGRERPFELPKMWEAQTAALSIPNTGLVVTMDIGNLNDVHPRNKQDVGKRLAFWALAKTYGRSDLVYSGPFYKSMTVEGNKIRISFDHIGSGLASRDSQPLTWFELAGADQKFVQAQADIDGDTVLVWSDSISKPVAARFGWNEVAQPNLINKEGLPALPFRTDRW